MPFASDAQRRAFFWHLAQERERLGAIARFQAGARGFQSAHPFLTEAAFAGSEAVVATLLTRQVLALTKMSASYGKLPRVARVAAQYSANRVVDRVLRRMVFGPRRLHQRTGRFGTAGRAVGGLGTQLAMRRLLPR